MDLPLIYWRNNRVKVSTKNYYCDYKGVRFGTKIESTEMYFVHKFIGGETLLGNGDPKNAYIKAVEFACSSDVNVMDIFLNSNAEKFRIYSSDDYAKLSDEAKRSTRTDKGKGQIQIAGENYYVATNLNICEYFNNLCDSIDAIDSWFVRIISEDERALKEPVETRIVEVKEKDIKLTEVLESTPKGKARTKRTVKIDYLSLGAKKKELGDLGECLVLEIEKKKLKDAGHRDLAEKVIHTAMLNDNAGYDIESYTVEGEPLFIEVKTTSYGKEDDFIISSNELRMAEEICSKGGHYCIYRVYNFDSDENKGKYTIYNAPLDQYFDFSPMSFRAKRKSI